MSVAEVQGKMRAMPESLKGIKPIDVDTHWTEPPDLWTSRAPAKYKDKVPYVKRTESGDRWFLNDKTLQMGGSGAAITIIAKGREKRHGVVTLDTYDEVDVSTWDPKARLEIMDDMGVWAQVVFPNIAGFGGGGVGEVVPEDNRNECLKIYNDAVAEWASISNGRLRPQALVPFWNIEAATKELVRAHEIGLKGVTLTSAPETWGDGLPDYGDHAWDGFWETVQALDMPVSFHIASGTMPDQLAPWKSYAVDPNAQSLPSSQRGSRQMAPTAASVVVGTLMNSRIMVNIIFSGLLDRFPKLKFASIESGLGWVPFFLELMEYQFDEFTFEDRWGLQRRPREYFNDHFWVSYWFEDFGPRHATQMMGPKNILWETDFPHPTCLYPDPVEKSAAALEAFPYEWRKAIMQDNAAALWKIPT